MKYVVSYREIVGKTLIVEAKDEHDARKKVMYEFSSGWIDLNKIDSIDQFITECYPACGLEQYPLIDDCLRPISEVS